MGRQKRKNKKTEVNHPKMMNNITEERFLELQTQAFYHAMRKIEDEKNVVEEVKSEKTSMLQDLSFMILLIIWPKKAKEKYNLRDDITNGVFSLISSMIMSIIGNIFRVLSLFIIIVSIYCVVTKVINIGIFMIPLFGAILTGIIGSMFVLSGEEISKERDSGVIMSYTSNIFAIVSVVLAVLAIVLAV